MVPIRVRILEVAATHEPVLVPGGVEPPLHPDL